MPFRGLRFLVVEDHPFQRTAMVCLLQSLGAAAIHVADDGIAAIEVIRDEARPVDIVVSDVSMPRMDGLEFVRRLAELGAPVSLIVSSALDRGTLEGVAAMARAYGARLLGVIGKPPTAAKLLPLVEAHAGAGRQRHGRDFTLEEITTSWVSGDFHVEFEPQVAVADRRLLALHAVPRWRHPELGMLDPEAFSTAIRSRGLQDEFAWFLLDTALDACRTWRQRELDVPASIPLLLHDLTDLSIAAGVVRAAQDKAVEPRHVILCVPAVSLGRDPRVLENIARLRMHGFALAVEAWDGSRESGIPGQQSLAEVRLAPAVVARAGRDPAGRASLQQLFAAAASAGVRTVASAVSSQAEWQLLQAMGCHAVQGPVVSGPLPVNSILRWAKQWEPQPVAGANHATSPPDDHRGNV
jgi:EAL domain-containing protein (putative c-di-GMP-specific phosphodiesterase class I)/FixJ family two-component response regulator